MAASAAPPATSKAEEEDDFMKGVRHLCDSGVRRLPRRYVLPPPDRPRSPPPPPSGSCSLPVVDLAVLRSGDGDPSARAAALATIDAACRDFGFFRVVNHGVPGDVLRGVIAAAERFFALPFDDRAALMSSDLRSPVRYGTSFNQLRDGVLCWRDFLKLACHPIDDVAKLWPSSPAELREKAVTYAKANKALFMELMGAVLEALGLSDGGCGGGELIREFDDGTHIMIVNCFPACPEPDLTLGMPPHSDFGFLTLLLQDDVEGLQVQHRGEWLTVRPVPDSFVVNVGDHLEIFSNGRYKSVLHRVKVNSARSRMSVANLHSMPVERVIRPAPQLVTPEHPRGYIDTDFAAFVQYISSCDSKSKNFLESRRIPGILA